MNRRELLLATTGALASAASGSALGMSGSSLVPLLGAASSAASVGAACALIPVQPVARATAGMRELCVKRFFPSLAGGASPLERLTLDLQMLDDRSQLQTVYAWQLSRRNSASWSGGFRMELPGQQVNLVINLRRRGSRASESWSGRPVVGVDSLLVTPRASTGQLPATADVRLDLSTPDLWMADGSQRDFDALLLSAT